MVSKDLGLSAEKRLKHEFGTESSAIKEIRYAVLQKQVTTCDPKLYSNLKAELRWHTIRAY
jgi:hypothetical protein